MGVSGCGKSTLGAALAATLAARFIDGDDLHPRANREKMAAGTPLTDADRAPWLARVGEALATPAPGEPAAVIVACSALKRAYRDIIRTHARGDVVFLHLTGAREVIAARLAARKGHFMPPSLLDSQLTTLEPLAPDETHALIDVALPLDAQLGASMAALRKDAA
jgi:carbohydrate kinase (thermoresistant glucokinase family)